MKIKYLNLWITWLIYNLLHELNATPTTFTGLPQENIESTTIPLNRIINSDKNDYSESNNGTKSSQFNSVYQTNNNYKQNNNHQIQLEKNYNNYQTNNNYKLNSLTQKLKYKNPSNKILKITHETNKYEKKKKNNMGKKNKIDSSEIKLNRYIKNRKKKNDLTDRKQKSILSSREINKVAAICNEIPSYGSCSQSFTKYFFDSFTLTCQTFIYSGCGGGNNMFDTLDLCRQYCFSHSIKDNFLNKEYNLTDPTVIPINRTVCSYPYEVGPCEEFQTRYYFNPVVMNCMPFTYGGCGGNQNNFLNILSCKNTCADFIRDADDINYEICTIPYKQGDCLNYQIRWFFDSNINNCRQFVFSGCNGNDNNFYTKELCLRSCRVTGSQIKYPQSKRKICLYSLEYGDCSDFITRYYFDTTANNCKQFVYSGCGGNENNFNQHIDCLLYCETGMSQVVINNIIRQYIEKTINSTIFDINENLKRIGAKYS